MPVAASPTTASVAASLCVQPFENLAGDPAQDYLARGLVEDLLTELSRFPGLELVRTRSAIRKIGASHAGLGRHLENSVRTGACCEYAPERRVDRAL